MNQHGNVLKCGNFNLVAELTAETICLTDWCFKWLTCSGWGLGLGLGFQFQLLSISEFRQTLTQSQ